MGYGGNDSVHGEVVTIEYSLYLYVLLSSWGRPLHCLGDTHMHPGDRGASSSKPQFHVSLDGTASAPPQSDRPRISQVSQLAQLPQLSHFAPKPSGRSGAALLHAEFSEDGGGGFPEDGRFTLKRCWERLKDCFKGCPCRCCSNRADINKSQFQGIQYQKVKTVDFEL